MLELAQSFQEQHVRTLNSAGLESSLIPARIEIFQ